RFEYRQHQTAVHFIVFPLSDLKRVIIENRDGFTYVSDQIDRHYNQVMDLYRRDINRAVAANGEFFGRTEIIEHLIESLKGSDMFAIVGPRRTGKSSLLLRLLRLESLDNYLLVYANVERILAGDIKNVYKGIITAIKVGLTKKYPQNKFPLDQF